MDRDLEDILDPLRPLPRWSPLTRYLNQSERIMYDAANITRPQTIRNITYNEASELSNENMILYSIPGTQLQSIEPLRKNRRYLPGIWGEQLVYNRLNKSGVYTNWHNEHIVTMMNNGINPQGLQEIASTSPTDLTALFQKRLTGKNADNQRITFDIPVGAGIEIKSFHNPGTIVSSLSAAEQTHNDFLVFVTQTEMAIRPMNQAAAELTAKRLGKGVSIDDAEARYNLANESYQNEQRLEREARRAMDGITAEDFGL